MGAAASAASPPPEAVPPADPPAAKVDTHPTAAASPPPEAAAPADPPAKEVDTQSAAASPPAEAADPPAKEDVQPAATAADAPTPADSPAKEEIQSSAPASGGDAEAEGESVVFDAAAAEAGEEEEVGECPFCLYMKGGGCKDEFVVWEKCIEEAEQEGGDVVERCAQATTALRSCMDKFPDYYEPILRVERTMSEDLEAAKAEAEAEASQDSPASSPPAPPAEGEQGDSKKQTDEVVVPKEKEDPAAA